MNPSFVTCRPLVDGHMYAIRSRVGNNAGSAAAPGVAKRLICPSATETVQSPGKLPAPAVYKTSRESDDQLSMLSRTGTSATLRGEPPCGLMTQIARRPSRSETNAICWPSGEYAGCWSKEVPDVRGR